MAALDPDMMARLVTAQLIGDAIEYRRDQAAMLCADCGPGEGGRCAGYAPGGGGDQDL